MKTEKLEKQLSYKSVNAWEKSNYSAKQVNKFSKNYKRFLSKYKTEREVTIAIEKALQGEGYKNAKGKKFYLTNKGKNIGIVRLGDKDLSQGVKLIVSHLDCPRLDLKQNPLYEDTDIAMMKTHYYGGIKKYQWVTRPLALHGFVMLANGKQVEISIGEEDDEPVFFIADLLPHLARKAQGDKKIGDAIVGEKLNIIVGSRPLESSKKRKNLVKLSILKILKKKYNMKESDFLTAEFEIVPAGKARDVGFDKSMIGGYGHDDRICSYAALKAILDAKSTKDTYVVLLVDKEEIGSDGNTGAKSFFLKQLIKQAFINKNKKVDMVKIEECLFNSVAISADVNGAIDPDYKEVHEERNAAKFGYGVCMTKFTGSGGKYSASDANSEYIAKMRKILDKANVSWQVGELGKVDEGGGGTIAKFIATYGMEVVDMGPALLAMHAPMELASKIDLFMTYKAYKTFFEKL